ncbi:MAG: class B sortase [Oscillospiraceae bacterium]|nr:class B sortase [Ruminococcus sp.]MCD8346016.1 class B sortase [Oscillospiraceae bacterium]
MNQAKPINKTALFLAAVMALSVFTACSKQIDEEPEVTEGTTVATEVTTAPTTTTEATTEPEPEPEMLEKYVEYYELNNDFVGWISIPGLTDSSGDMYIDYPVVQADDNSEYLELSFEREKSSAGCIYADYKVPITAKSHADNITLYGHSMANGTYFRHLLDYKNGVDVVQDSYIINFDTLWEENQYVIVACFLIGIYEWQDSEPLFEYYKCRNFDTEEDYNYFYENIMLRTYYNSNVECEYGDEFLTLSTCAYDFDDSRWVVVARKVREGEDTSGYTYEKNSSRHKPDSVSYNY